MVFLETLKTCENEVKEAVAELFDTAFKNQKVDTDLLIVLIHGYYDEKHLEFSKREKLSPYVFGPNHIGYSLHTFYNFFHFYRTTAISKKKFEKDLKKESDLLLRQLFNLVNLASGKYYAWDFMLSYSRRSLIRQQIQAPMKTICPKFYKLVDENYSAQIRNAVAHSKYYFLGRNLQLANKEENEFYKLFNISFEDWEIRFHKTLLFYNFIIGNLQRYDNLYQQEVSDKHFGLPLSTPRLNHLGLRKNQWVKYDNQRKRWLWSTQLDD